MPFSMPAPCSLEIILLVCAGFTLQWRLCAWSLALAIAPVRNRLPSAHHPSLFALPPEAREVHSQAVCSIGRQPFDAAELIKAELPKILEAFGRRPNGANDGGTRLMHASYLWIVIRWLKPRHVIEVGAFKGAGTWFMREACGDCQITVVSPDTPEVYRDSRADSVYFTGKDFQDFRDIAWEKVIPSREAREKETFIFFDDHHAHIPRLQEARKAGFAHVAFDDNAWYGSGDSFSLKDACDPDRTLFLEPERPRRRVYRDNFNNVVRDMDYSEALEHFWEMLRLVDFYMEMPPWWMVPVPKYTYCPDCNQSRLMHKPMWSLAEAPKILGAVAEKVDYQFEADGFLSFSFLRLQT